MEIDYIFPRRIFSSKKFASAKILTESKKAFIKCIKSWPHANNSENKISQLV